MPLPCAANIKSNPIMLMVVYNASDNAFSAPLPEGGWIIRADGQCADQHTTVSGPLVRVRRPWRSRGRLYQRGF